MDRRKFLLTVSATSLGTALVHGCGSSPPPDPNSPSTPSSTSPVNISSADAPETPKVILGFIALSDFAPLAIAKEKGFFDKYGMTEAQVLKQKSWASTRDNLEFGSEGGGIDGGHVLSTIPYQLALGKITKGGKELPMYLLARTHADGQAISIANKYKQLGVKVDTKLLKPKVEEGKASGNPLVFADTFPGGTHWAMIRYWLAAGGINPEEDVKMISVPPPQMVANMKAGNMDAFCVSEPWHLQLLNQGLGYTACFTGEIWRGEPNKSFAMRAAYVDKYPKATKAILKAIMEAQMWCDKPENKQEMCEIISQSQWIGVPVADIIDRSQGKINYGDDRPIVENSPFTMRYWEDASFPYKSHDKWYLTEQRRWGMLPAGFDYKIIDTVNRSDIWRECAKEIGQEAAIPKSDSKGIETFFDGIKFDPEKPDAYLDLQKIKKLA